MNKKCCDKETICTVVGQNIPPVDLCHDHSIGYDSCIEHGYNHVKSLKEIGIDLD